jgi:hypothetical protein
VAKAARYGEARRVQDLAVTYTLVLLQHFHRQGVSPTSAAKAYAVLLATRFHYSIEIPDSDIYAVRIPSDGSPPSADTSEDDRSHPRMGMDGC